MLIIYKKVASYLKINRIIYTSDTIEHIVYIKIWIIFSLYLTFLQLPRALVRPFEKKKKV